MGDVSQSDKQRHGRFGSCFEVIFVPVPPYQEGKEKLDGEVWRLISNGVALAFDLDCERGARVHTNLVGDLTKRA